MSVLKTQLDMLADNLDMLGIVKQDLLAALETAGVTIPENPSFIWIADAIYNLNCEESESFISANSADFPTDTGIKGISSKIKYMGVAKDAIFNALRARFIPVGPISLEDVIDYIPTIEGDDRLLPIENVVTTTVSRLVTKINMQFEENYTYYIGTNVNVSTEMDYIQTECTIIDAEEFDMEVGQYDMITIFGVSEDEVKKVYCFKPALDATVIPDHITIESTYGSMIGYTVINVVDRDENLSYYYAPFTGQELYKDDVIDISDYLPLDGEIYSVDMPIILVIGVDNLYRIKQAGNTLTNPAFEAPTFSLNSIAGSEYNQTVIQVYNEKAYPEDEYYYYNGSDFIPCYEQVLPDDDRFIKWNEASPIRADNKSILSMYEVTSERKIIKYGQVVVRSYVPALARISIENVEGSEDLESVVTITSELVHSGNRRYYKIADDLNLPAYGTEVDDTYTPFNGSTIVIKVPNGGYVKIVERYAVIGGIEAATSFIAKSKIAYIKTLVVTSEPGSTKGTSIVTLNPTQTSGYVYYYTKGNVPVHYDMDIDDRWVYWDGHSELSNLEMNQIVTIIEAENRKARKVGVACLNVRPQELETLELTSKRSSKAGCTVITVVPKVESGNHYRYAFINRIPDLFEDVSYWEYWNGSSPIEATDGVNIVVAEVNGMDKVIKAGSCTVVAKDPDPELGTLTVTYDRVIDTVTLQYFVIPHIAEELEDGYEWRWLYTSETIEDYHHDCTSWHSWDGESRIQYSEDNMLTFAQTTTDGYATKIGRVMVTS